MSSSGVPARLLWIVERDSIESGALALALRASVPWLHLRDPSVSAGEWRGLLGGSCGPSVVVNGGPAWARTAGWGAHLKTAQAPLDPSARAGWKLLGRSVHDPEQTRRAVHDDPDYLVAGPVYPTASKPGHRGIGLDGVRAIVACAEGRPVLAIGGIHPGRVAAVLEAGAFGVSVRSGITAAGDPAGVIAAFLDALPVDSR